MTKEALFRNVGTKSRLVTRVADDIQRLIAEGKLAPGAKLPPERDLAEILGVSRTVVREAVHILAAKGLLESRHGSGTVVRQVSRDALVEPLGWLIQSHGATLDNLHAVRSILEVEIVRLATLQATGEELAELQRIVSEMGARKEDVTAFVALDADFHQTLSEITHNPLLALLLDSIRDLMQAVRIQVHRNAVVYDTVVPDHERIVAAMQTRDPEAAAREMQRHLDNARAFQRELLAAPMNSTLEAAGEHVS